jgi:hypothetical protein
MKTVALLTDFGDTDGFVGMMKGEMLKIAPELTIIDITHHISSFDLRAAAFILQRSLSHYPQGTIFTVVVDPGVGSDRRIIAAQAGGFNFVAPDNGVISYALQGFQERKLVSVENSDIFLPNPSSTFHGRDIMAPAAAYLATGAELEALGPEIDSYRVLPIPNLLKHGHAVIGEIIYVDKFGNLISNITKDDLPQVEEHRKLTCIVGDGCVANFAASYSEGRGLSAIVSGFDTVEIFINQGSAASQFVNPIGTPLAIESRQE